MTCKVVAPIRCLTVMRMCLVVQALPIFFVVETSVNLCSVCQIVFRIRASGL